MRTIRCCQCEQNPTEAKEIESRVENHRQMYLLLKNCIKCGKRTLEVITVNVWDQTINRRRIKTKNIDSFLKNNKTIRDIPNIKYSRIKPRMNIIVSEYSRRMARNKNKTY